MKKSFKYYFAVWAVLCVLFNVIVFVAANWLGEEQYTPSFWIGYAFIMLSFVGQVVCSYFALKEDDIKKTFYNISLITTSYTELVLSFIIGGLCMMVPQIPYQLGIILCVALLGFNVIALVKASAAINLVGEIDEKVKGKTLFVKSLTVDAESLMQHAKSEEAKAECKQVYEAVRYSDPLSNNALAAIESEITIMFAEFSEAVENDNVALTAEISKKLIVLLGDRNKKCKLLK